MSYEPDTMCLLSCENAIETILSGMQRRAILFQSLFNVSIPVLCRLTASTYIASTLRVGLIQILDTQTNLISGSLEHQHETRSIAMSFDGKYIVFGDRDRMIHVRDVESGDLVSGPFEGHTDTVTPHHWLRRCTSCQAKMQ
jgi:WD40 repeat protein